MQGVRIKRYFFKSPHNIFDSHVVIERRARITCAQVEKLEMVAMLDFHHGQPRLTTDGMDQPQEAPKNQGLQGKGLNQRQFSN